MGLDAAAKLSNDYCITLNNRFLKIAKAKEIHGSYLIFRWWLILFSAKCLLNKIIFFNKLEKVNGKGIMQNGF